MNKKVYHPDGRRLVFRVQCKHYAGTNNPEFRAGAYNWQSNLADRLLACTLADDDHPLPHHDNGLANFWQGLEDSGEYKPWLFGFRDMDQLTNWFMYPERNAQNVDVGEIGVYAVDECYCVDGQFQTIFNCKCAEQVAILPLDTTEFDPTTLQPL